MTNQTPTPAELILAAALAHGAKFEMLDDETAANITAYREQLVTECGDPCYALTAKAGDVLFCAAEQFWNDFDQYGSYETLAETAGWLMGATQEQVLKTAFRVATGYELDEVGSDEPKAVDAEARAERAKSEGWELPIANAELIACPKVIAELPAARGWLARMNAPA